MCGVYLNRSYFMITLYDIPFFLILWYLEPLLLFFGQDAKTCMLAGIYVRYYLPGLYCETLYDSTRRLLISVKKPTPAMIIQIVTTIIHVGWCYLFIAHLNMGVKGAGLAITCTSSLNFFLLSLAGRLNKDLKGVFSSPFTWEST